MVPPHEHHRIRLVRLAGPVTGLGAALAGANHHTGIALALLCACGAIFGWHAVSLWRSLTLLAAARRHR